MRLSVEVATMRGLLCKIQHRSITFLLKVSSWTSQRAAMFVGEINYKHFADSRTRLELDPAEHTKERW